MNKIVVVGTTGSGKSTLSTKLSDKLDIPYIQLDKLFWKPNWEWTKDEEFFKKIEGAIKDKDSWIIDGNYSRTRHITWAQADTVIWIDLPFYIVLKQNLLRALKRIYTKEELWPNTGNVETLNRLLSKDSIIKWLFKTYPIMKKRYNDAMSDPQYSKIKFVQLTSHREANAFLRRLA
jgi:adenylate kinase family enzyme